MTLSAAPARIQDFFALRARWAQTHNLSGPRALQDPETVDLSDARAVAEALAPDLLLVDVGAGSGAPGILVACLHPNQRVLLVEPTVKKVAFLRTAIHALGLTNVQVLRARWPAVLPEPAQVVSRAVIAPELWPELALEGGTQVHSVLRCLAARRPGWTPLGFECARVVDYRAGEAERRVERWDRLNLLAALPS